MTTARWLALGLVAAACADPAAPPVEAPKASASPHAVSPASQVAIPEIAPERDAPRAPPAAPAAEPWLRGSTHVHARPSGDSATPIAQVIQWYETRGYDFIVLTDHNKVSEVDGNTEGKPFVRFPDKGLVVLAGTELTHNPTGCLPAGDATNACHIHANLLGVTARPTGKIGWAKHGTKQRLDKYTAALDQQKRLGGIAQINHPQWHYGMTVDVLTELANRGFRLVEVANIQFKTWNRGSGGKHLSTEALWDGALARGVTLWGVASDDAHHYDGKGRWPAGGGWIVVRARRDPQAILDAIDAGRFYASTGVELVRAEPADGALVVEVAAADPGKHAIAFVENGKVVETVQGKAAKRAIPATGYVRAVVTRDDGKQAWVQPARTP